MKGLKIQLLGFVLFTIANIAIFLEREGGSILLLFWSGLVLMTIAIFVGDEQNKG